MIEILLNRLKQGNKTIPYPRETPELPLRYRGLPKIDPSQCQENCQKCIDPCPTGALSLSPDLQIDLGKCIFCTACTDECPQGAIEFTRDHRMATSRKKDLVLGKEELRLAGALEKKMLKIFGRSLKLRVVSAGDCNGCSVEINVLSTIVFDLSRFGIQVVASPRHADGLVIAGPVSKNMREALRKTYDALPAPKIVMAVGACAISGGLFLDHPETHKGIGNLFPAELYVPGCPPHPLTILDGLLRLLGRIE